MDMFIYWDRRETVKRICLCLALVLLLCGCDVNYQLSFNGEHLDESIQISINKENQEKIDYLKSIPAYAIYNNMNEELYESKFIDKKDHFEAEYQYEYDLTNINQAYYINQCFDATSFVKNNDQYILSTSEGFKCMFYEYHTIDNVTITITTNHEVLKNNADIQKGDRYIWKITNENADAVKINMVFGKERRKNLRDYFYEHPLLITSLIVISIFGIIYIIIVIMKSKKNNEM